MQLRRSISNKGLLFSAVGGIVGSGWLLGPLFAAKIAGPAAILSWIIGGLLMMIIALTYAELASALPLSGGTVRFLHFSHGTFASFTIAWLGWLASAAVPPIETMALLHYADNYWPGLMHTEQGTNVLTSMGFCVAIALIFIMSFINIMGVKLLSKTNSLIVAVKLLFPIITIATLLTLDFHVTNFTQHSFMPYGLKGILAALPAAGVIFSFIGYAPAIQLAGEAKDPQRAIPFAILGALILCIVLYVLLQISFIGALDEKTILHGWSQLSFSGESGPFAGIAMAIGAMWLTKLLFVGSFISPFGTALIYTGSTARMTFAMGKNGYLPNWLMRVNRFGVPARLILLNFLIGVILFLPFPSWQSLMGFLVSALVLAYTVGPLALGVLRKKLPDLKRPFKIKSYRITTLLGFYICNLIIFWTGWHIIASMLIATVIGYVFLLAYQLLHPNKLSLQLKGGWWLIPYLLGMGVFSALSTFGGGTGQLAFGWDFVVLAAFSAIIFWLAQRAGRQTATPMDELKAELEQAMKKH